MLTNDDAEHAMALVRHHYNAWYPKHLDAKDAPQVFVFLEPDAFAQKFAITYNGTFKAANGWNFSAGQVVGYVNGFVAADRHNFQRRIYVKKVEAITWGTLVHEYIHYLQHRNFYPDFYSVGGSNPDLVEGVTEYLTRATCVELQKSRTSYKSQFLQCSSWLGSGGSRYDDMMRFCFQGVRCALC